MWSPALPRMDRQDSKIRKYANSHTFLWMPRASVYFHPPVISGLCTNSSANVACVLCRRWLWNSARTFLSIPLFCVTWRRAPGLVWMSLPWLEWLGCLQRLRWPAPIMRDSYIGPRPGNEITWWRLAPLDFLLTASIFLPS